MAIGKKLEEARNRKGISLREASESTKIRGDYLSSFETGQFDINLPEVYLRGFIRLYAEFLDLDQEAILADLELELGSQPNRNAKKSLGSISPQEGTEGGDIQGLPNSSSQRYGDNRTFDSMRKPLLLVGSLFVVTVLIIIAVIANSNGTQEDSELSVQAEDGELQSVEETNSEIDRQVVEGVRTLNLSATGAIERLIVSDEGSDPKVYHEFKDVQSGWSNDLPFTNSLKCYSSSLQNIRFAVDGGIFKAPVGNGAGGFSWSPSLNEQVE
jgi:cytoskeletal protein RodZ